MQNFDLARQGQRAKKVHRRVSCPSAGVENKPSKCNIRAGKGLAKAAQGVLGPGGKCFAQVLKPLLNAEFRPGKAGAKGERGTGGFRVLVKRAWSRCGKPSKCNIRPGKALAKSCSESFGATQVQRAKKL